MKTKEKILNIDLSSTNEKLILDIKLTKLISNLILKYKAYNLCDPGIEIRTIIDIIKFFGGSINTSILNFDTSIDKTIYIKGNLTEDIKSQFFIDWGDGTPILMSPIESNEYYHTYNDDSDSHTVIISNRLNISETSNLLQESEALINLENEDYSDIISKQILKLIDIDNEIITNINENKFVKNDILLGKTYDISYENDRLIAIKDILLALGCTTE